jgi:hypothetical protein
MRNARPLIAATPGFGGMTLRRCCEAPHRVVGQFDLSTG